MAKQRVCRCRGNFRLREREGGRERWRYRFRSGTRSRQHRRPPARMRKATKREKSEEVLLPLQCSLSSHVMYSFIVAAPFVSASQFMTWEGATKDPLLVAAVAASLNAAAVFLLQCQMNSFINVPPTKGVDNVTEVRWARGICRSFLPPSLPPRITGDHRH